VHVNIVSYHIVLTAVLLPAPVPVDNLSRHDKWHGFFTVS